MTDFESKIYKVILEHDGIKGAEIAAILEVEKSVVNSTLWNSDALNNLVKLENYKWYVINKNEYDDHTENIQEPDEELHNLCNYYLRCISTETNNSVSQFLTSSYDLNYVVLDGINIDAIRGEHSIDLLSKISMNNAKTSYFGYPVRIFTIYSRTGKYKKIAPLFLFPIEYKSGVINVSWTPNINMEVIKAYTDGEEGACRELISLEKELGVTDNTEIELDELVLKLKSIRDWDWKEEINPYQIPAVTSLADFEDGIYNRPIVVTADKEMYTQGLVSELMSLSNVSPESYKGTALYSWIKNEYKTMRTEDIKPLLEVLPLNTEQSQAVDTALHSNLTVVTGPPGTGKSQVVTDLLINIAWNGKSALFSSKNNKAVDVVDLRVNSLSKRPILLRIGSNQYASRLAEIIEGLLNAKPLETDKADSDYYLSLYNLKGDERKRLIKEKERIISLRNKLDDIEQAYCLVRNQVELYFDTDFFSDVGNIQIRAELFRKAYSETIKEKQSLFIKILWPLLKNNRLRNCDYSVVAYNELAQKYNLLKAERNLSEDEVNNLVNDARVFDDALSVAREYKSLLKEFELTKSIADIDRLLINIKNELANIAEKLWDKWLVSQSIKVSAEDRLEMSSFIASMRLTGSVSGALDVQMRRKYASISKRMTKYLPCWAVTSLSAKSRVPFIPGLFDYVIIDEASQCDIASILPLLYRAKRAIIIGDPKQLSHISLLPKEQDLALLERFDVPVAWSYSASSLYSLAEGKVNCEDIVHLRDHFRSHSDIIEFSNKYFYEGNLRTATRYDRLKTPSGEKPGIRWINVIGKTIRPSSGSAYNIDESEAVVKELKRLADSDYIGTIGVTTPFRAQADKIKTMLERNEPETYRRLLTNHEFIADTVHKFQEDERDLMIFSSVVSDGTSSKSLGFLNSTGNLFNVAITRARAILVVVGNYSYCSSCEVQYLRSFADYYDKLNKVGDFREKETPIPNSREYPWVENPELVSEWERKLYTALYDVGIQTIPQYPVEKYRLDLAVITKDGRKLDIEVDGEMYHKSWNGELSYRDQLRNQRLFELGWDVKRFWVYQIRDEMKQCIDQIKEWIG